MPQHVLVEWDWQKYSPSLQRGGGESETRKVFYGNNNWCSIDLEMMDDIVAMFLFFIYSSCVALVCVTVIIIAK